MTIKEVAIDAANPAKIPAAMEPGLAATAVYKAGMQNFPERLPCLRSRNPQGNRRGRYRALQRGRRRRHRAQSAAAARPDPRRHRPRRRPGADGRHPFRLQRPAGHRLVHGLRHAARAPSADIQVKCNPVPTRPIRSAPRAPAKPAVSARCRPSPTRWSTRSPISASGISRCRRRRSASGGRCNQGLAPPRGLPRPRGKCRPHSRLLLFSHHQRPLRSGSPGAMARVHGAQPIDAKPLSCSAIDRHADAARFGQHGLARPVVQRVELEHAAAGVEAGQAGLAPVGILVAAQAR